jgi:uncharacterized protein (TIGR00251 family)
MSAWEAQADALLLRVRVTPKGGRDAITGLDLLADGRAVLKMRVRAAPENGAANEAVRRTLAKALGVAAAAVSLTAGATARLKTLRVAGDAPTLAATLARLSQPQAA